MSCRRATSDTTAPGANDSATIRPLSALFHRRRRPTPLRISTRPRGAEASTIWSTIYANRCHQLVRIFRTMPLAARWGKDTAYDLPQVLHDRTAKTGGRSRSGGLEMVLGFLPAPAVRPHPTADGPCSRSTPRVRTV